MSKLKSLAGDTLLYGLGNMVPRLLNFLLFPLHTKFFDTEAYGVLTYLMSAVALLMVIYSFGMETAYFRFATKTGDENKTFRQAQTVVVLISVLLSVAILLAYQPIAIYMGVGDRPEWIVWLVAIMLIDSLVIIPFARLRLQKKPIQFSIYKISNVGILTGLNFYFLYYNFDPSTGIGYIILANLIANAFYLLFFAKTLWSWRPAWEKAISLNMMQYAYPIMLTGLAGMTNEFFSRLALKEWLPEGFYPGKTNEHAEGVLGGAYKFAVFMNLAVQAFRMAAEPFFFQQASDKNSPQLFATINHYFIILCCIVLVGIGINTDVLKLIFLKRESYWEGLVIVPPLLMGYLLLGVYYNFSVWFKLKDKTYAGTLTTLVGLMVTLVGNYFLIPLMGYEGSAWTSFLCYATMAIVCYLWGKHHFPVPYTIVKDGSYLIVSFLLVYAIQFYIHHANFWISILLKNGVFICFLLIIFWIEKKPLLAYLQRKTFNKIN
jgi:O-antigen/teichoic acid export membrane protein